MIVRLATVADADEVLAIYAPAVLESWISFEVQLPSVEEMRRRMAAIVDTWPWLVADEGGPVAGDAGTVAGYAYASRLRERAAYAWNVEVTVYVAAWARRRGVARRLYGVLLGLLEAQGFGAAYGIIALPNPESVALHERLGFGQVAHLPRAGIKHGRWHDVGFWRRDVGAPLGAEPAPPLPIGALPRERIDELLAAGE